MVYHVSVPRKKFMSDNWDDDSINQLRDKYVLQFVCIQFVCVKKTMDHQSEARVCDNECVIGLDYVGDVRIRHETAARCVIHFIAFLKCGTRSITAVWASPDDLLWSMQNEERFEVHTHYFDVNLNQQLINLNSWNWIESWIRLLKCVRLPTNRYN